MIGVPAGVKVHLALGYTLPPYMRGRINLLEAT
jgi:hypothetical protein